MYANTDITTTGVQLRSKYTDYNKLAACWVWGLAVFGKTSQVNRQVNRVETLCKW